LKKNWLVGPKKSAAFRCFFFQRFDHGAAQKIERKMSHLKIAFDRYASIGTVILEISLPFTDLRNFLHRKKCSHQEVNVSQNLAKKLQTKNLCIAKISQNFSIH